MSGPGSQRARAGAFVLIMMGASLWAAVPVEAAPAPLSAGYSEVLLYLHSNNDLTPASNSREGPGTIASGRTWLMPQGVLNNSCVEAGDSGSGATAYNLFLNVSYAYPTSGWNIRISLKDEDKVIAEHSETVSNTAGVIPDWPLAFNSNRTSCDIARNHRLAIVVTADHTLGITNIAGANLQLWVRDVIAPTASTYRGTAATDIFYPNDADANRQVSVRGVLNSLFGASLVSSVRMEFLNPSGVSQANVTASLNDQNFSYTWAYNVGQPAGVFQAVVTVTDVQGATYAVVKTFTMAGYGLRIDTAGQTNGSATRTTTETVAAIFDLTVTNIGGSPTTAQIAVQNPPPSGWSTEFIPGGDLALEAGQGKPVTFRVIPSASITAGQSTQVTVVARALNDPAAIKAQAVLATTTIVVERTSLEITPLRTDATVKLGDTQRYDFNIMNHGGAATDVLFNATAPPAGWDRTLEGPGLVANGAGWRLTGLGNTDPVTLTLVVIAPSNSTSNAVFDCVVLASAEQDPSAQATFTGSTILLLGIELVQITFPAPAAPGAPPLEFQVEARNTDPLNTHTLDASSVTWSEAAGNPQTLDGQSGGHITRFVPDGCCAPQKSVTITVNVQLPSRALQGRYVITLSAVIDGDSSHVVELNLSLNITSVVAYQLVADPAVDSLTIGEAPLTVALTVQSGSNKQLVLDLRGEVRGTRPGEFWTIEFLDANGAVLDPQRVTLAAYGSVQVTARIKAPNTVLNGDQRELVLRVEQAGNNAPVELSPHPSVKVELAPLSRVTRFAADLPNLFLLIMFAGWGLLCLRWGFSIRRRLKGGAPAAVAGSPPKGGSPPPPARPKPSRPVK